MGHIMSKHSLIGCAGLLVWLAAAPPALRAQGAAATSSAPLLTLDDAIAMALAGNAQVQARSLDVTRAAAAVDESRAARLPQLATEFLGGVALTPINFTIPRGTLGTYTNVGPLPATDSRITTPRQFSGLFLTSVTQPVSQLFKIGLAVREAETGQRLASEGARASRAETIRQVRLAYANLAQVQSQLAGAEAALAALTELAGLMDRRLADEAVLKSDDLAVKAKLGQQQYQTLVLRNTLDSDREAFNRLLGRDLGVAFSVSPLPPVGGDDLNVTAAETQALAARPELAQARLQVQKASLEIRRTKADAWPDVSVQLNYLSFPNVNFLPANIAHLGIVATWQPFDWGARRKKVAQLSIAQQQATLAETDAEVQVRAEVRAAARKLAEARALVGAETLAVDTDRERVRVLMNRYHEDSSLLADVLQAQAAMAATDADFQQALAGFWAAKANFDRATGQQGEKDR